VTKEIIFTALICGLTWAVLRDGWLLQVRKLDMRPPGNALIMAALSIAAAVYFWGISGGIAIIVCIVVHEFGHVAAFRVSGHPDATFRLIPLMGGVAISKTAPKTDLHQFYISIMGPGICLALMLVAFQLEIYFRYINPDIAYFFSNLGRITATINFFNLLPIWPLDGGKIMRILTQGFLPKTTFYTTIIACVLFAIFGMLSRSVFIVVISVIGIKGALNMPKYRVRHGLSVGQLLQATGAYLAMLGAFALGSIQFIFAYL